MSEDYYTRGEKEFLLKIARTTLKKKLLRGGKFEPQTVNQKLWKKRGVFVSLSTNRQLRGCIGYLEPVESLILGVRDNALAAARDPRFLPLRTSELEETIIEISILTPPEKISFSEIKKKEGVILRQGSKSATYLPQVWEKVSKKEEFFQSLCQKAGLDSQCYLSPKTEILRYQAIVFREGRI